VAFVIHVDIITLKLRSNFLADAPVNLKIEIFRFGQVVTVIEVY